MISHIQLRHLGYSRDEIQHRINMGRLHRVHRGVYAVGRPELTQEGRWMAAVLACGDGALLSHESAAALWGIRPIQRGPIHITVPGSNRDHAGIKLHRRPTADGEATTQRNIPLTQPLFTLVDLAASLKIGPLERAINEADRLDLIDPETLREGIEGLRRKGAPNLRRVLDRTMFVLTDSELERRFIPLAMKAGLPKPITQARVRGYKVDFYFPDHNLIVETDGLRYHRTPQQQLKDRLRDQRLQAAGYQVLRFAHVQIAKDPRHVTAMLRSTRP